MQIGSQATCLNFFLRGLTDWNLTVMGGFDVLKKNCSHEAPMIEKMSLGIDIMF